MAKLNSVLLLLAATLLLPGSQAAEPIDVAIEAHDQAQLELAQWGIDRYAEAGLDLPPLVIRFPGRDLAHCGGAAARADTTLDPVEIRVCWNDGFIVLHELAHVWLAHNLPIEHRGPFMATRNGVEFWNSQDVPWESRGGEHAANVIAWGLLDDPYPISRTYPNDVASMIDAFTFLTDVEPLHDGGPDIQYPDRSLYGLGLGNTELDSGR